MVRGKLVEMVDQDKVREAVRLLLEGIGEDPTREGLGATPDRGARMYSELCDGMDRSASEHLAKTFAVSGDDLVIERDITLRFRGSSNQRLIDMPATLAAFAAGSAPAAAVRLWRDAEVSATHLM